MLMFWGKCFMGMLFFCCLFYNLFLIYSKYLYIFFMRFIKILVKGFNYLKELEYFEKGDK